MAGKASTQQDSMKKILVVVLLAIAVILIGYRIYGAQRAAQAAKKIEQEVQQGFDIPMGPPGVYRQWQQKAGGQTQGQQPGQGGY
jgi:hypothetical protein